MRAQHHDGRTARARTLDLVVVDGRLSGTEADGESLDWPLADISAEPLADGRVRLSARGREGRLIVAGEDWAALNGGRRNERKEWRLVAVLAASGAAFAALVFLGIPAASGPLSRATPASLETSIGRNIESQITLVLRSCEGSEAGAAQLQALGDDLSLAASAQFPIRVKAVEAPIVNAFALPGGVILVTDDLIEGAEGPDELAGVLAHEVAHVERRHVMRSVWRSMGIGLILDAVLGGGTGAGQQAVLLASSISDQRFSRSLEAEADDRALEILAARRISSAGLAVFFDRMADKKASQSARDVAEWFATHPDSGRRAAHVRAAARPGRPAMTPQAWDELKAVCA